MRRGRSDASSRSRRRCRAARDIGRRQGATRSVLRRRHRRRARRDVRRRHWPRAGSGRWWPSTPRSCSAATTTSSTTWPSSRCRWCSAWTARAWWARTARRTWGCTTSRTCSPCPNMTVTAPRTGARCSGCCAPASAHDAGPFCLRYPRDAAPDDTPRDGGHRAGAVRHVGRGCAAAPTWPSSPWARWSVPSLAAADALAAEGLERHRRQLPLSQAVRRGDARRRARRAQAHARGGGGHGGERIRRVHERGHRAT